MKLRFYKIPSFFTLIKTLDGRKFGISLLSFSFILLFWFCRSFHYTSLNHVFFLLFLYLLHLETQKFSSFVYIGSNVNSYPIMYLGPCLNGPQLHERRKLESNITKLSQTRSDIIFLSKCRKMDIIPHGFRLKNTLQIDCVPLARFHETLVTHFG